ncbi:MAG: T9SS type A sorting domain-containing protein [candidate division Zixibacteria bacterium]|nr:T9SS type A sorting domain-containing protein [candidate division Zixibacteria bacterium]
MLHFKNLIGPFVLFLGIAVNASEIGSQVSAMERSITAGIVDSKQPIATQEPNSVSDPGRFTVEFQLINLLSDEALPDVEFLLLDDSVFQHFATDEIDRVNEFVKAGLPFIIKGNGDCFRKSIGLPADTRSSPGGPTLIYGFKLLHNKVISDLHIVGTIADVDTIRMQTEVLSESSPLTESRKPGPEDNKTLTRKSTLQRAIDWVLEERVIQAPPEAVVGSGAWDAAYTTRWQTDTNTDKYVCTWDFDIFKLIDIRPTKDYYLIATRPHTEIVSYTGSYSSAVGYYVHSRVASHDLDYYDIDDYRESMLVEYEPTGTVSGSSVGWTIGAGLSTESGGIDARYSQTWNSLDVTVVDRSSLLDAVSEWHESFKGPNYSWYPILSHPCNNARSSHHSELAATVRVMSDEVNPPNGMKTYIAVLNTIYYDTNFRWYVFILKWDRYTYHPGFTGSIRVNYNRAPEITHYNPSNDVLNVQAGQFVDFDVEAADPDGTVPTCTWYLDGESEGTGDTWRYSPGPEDEGTHQVKVVASDGEDTDDQIWTVNVNVPWHFISITTSPWEFTITVDGGDYTAPHIFNWPQGSAHSIGVSSPQITPEEEYYYFSHWSDGGGQTHWITVPAHDETYTAHFERSDVEEFSDERGVPNDYWLSQNYPNPFNPYTEIEFGLPVPGPVKIEIFNVLGERVITLVDEFLSAGYKLVSWDGRDKHGNEVSSGIYFCRLGAANFTETRKMALMK